MTKGDKGFAKEPGFKDTKCPVKIRDIKKLKERVLSTLALLVIKIK